MTLHGRPVVRCDKLTMEVVNRFPSIAVAAVCTGKRASSIETACECGQVSSGRYVWRYLDRYCPDETFEGRKNRPIRARDVETGEERLFCSFGEAAKALYTNRDYLSRCRISGRLAYGRHEITFAR